MWMSATSEVLRLAAVTPSQAARNAPSVQFGPRAVCREGPGLAGREEQQHTGTESLRAQRLNH